MKDWGPLGLCHLDYANESAAHQESYTNRVIPVEQYSAHHIFPIRIPKMDAMSPKKELTYLYCLSLDLFIGSKLVGRRRSRQDQYTERKQSSASGGGQDNPKSLKPLAKVTLNLGTFCLLITESHSQDRWLTKFNRCLSPFFCLHKQKEALPYLTLT